MGKEDVPLLNRLFGEKKKTLLGVDIGSSSVKLLQLARAGSGYRVACYATRRLPPNSIVEKQVVSVEGLGETLHKLATVTRTSGASVAVAVSGSAVITKTIAMPASLNEAELENQIIVEADQYIPYPLDEVAIDFERIAESPSNPDMSDVLLAACKKEHVDLRVTALEIAGFSAKVVDIEAYAMARAYRVFSEQAGLQTYRVVALFDIGATISTLHIIVDGRSLYTREQSFGAAQLTAQVQTAYGFPTVEAETAIREGTLIQQGPYASDILAPFQTEVSEQISRALQFFFLSSQYNAVDLIILAGGVASSKGLAEEVEAALLTRTLIADPCVGMPVGPQVNQSGLMQDAPSLMLACGLALRGLEA